MNKISMDAGAEKKWKGLPSGGRVRLVRIRPGPEIIQETNPAMKIVIGHELEGDR